MIYFDFWNTLVSRQKAATCFLGTVWTGEQSLELIDLVYKVKYTGNCCLLRRSHECAYVFYDDYKRRSSAKLEKHSPTVTMVGEKALGLIEICHQSPLLWNRFGKLTYQVEVDEDGYLVLHGGSQPLCSCTWLLWRGSQYRCHGECG
jgi:hypothetical protein